MAEVVDSVRPPVDRQEENDAMDALSRMTHEELAKECLSLKKQNGLLNCRLLGVEELARLLQEKTESVENYKDKNKRLELAVVRLENRCSNMDRKSKSQVQQSISLPSSSNKGPSSLQQPIQQNPFIPGPSKQILETLMKENRDLKNTLDNMTKKGPTGYREAVKVNQLEEVIDQKNEKIEMLSGQLESLTAAQKNGENGGTDLGTLQRQLLKMEHSMKVKDRFCTLLSERVNHLQKELEKGIDQPDLPGSDVGQNETSKGNTLLDTLTKEFEVKERNMRKMMDELQQQVEKERDEKMDAITQAEDHRQKLIEKQNELDTLQSKFDDSNMYTESLLNEKLSLIKQLEDVTKSDGSGDKDPSRSQYQREVENKNMQIDQLKRLLEDAQYKYALAESKQVHFERIEELEDKVKDLEEERSTLESEIYDNKRRIQDLMNHNTRLRFGHLGSHTPSSYVMRSGGAPSLHLQSHHGEDVFADSSKSIHDIVKDTLRHEVPPINYISRDVKTDGVTDSTSVSETTPTYTTPETSSTVRTLQSSTNPPPVSSTPSSVSSPRMYRNNLPGTPVMTPHVYPGSSGASQMFGTYHQDIVTPRNPYASDTSYQTHPSTGYTNAPQYTVPMHFGTSAPNRANPSMSMPLQRSLSSSPGPSYMTSSFPLHSNVPSQSTQVTQSNVPTIFGQQPLGSGGSHHTSQYSGMMFGGGGSSGVTNSGGYVTTPGAYTPQYHQPGQRPYDTMSSSQPHYGGFFTAGGYIPAPTSTNTQPQQPGSANNTMGGINFSSSQPPSSGGPLPPNQMQRRHSPPDPRN